MSSLRKTAADYLKLPPSAGGHGNRWKVPTADEVRALRKRLDLSQEQFADMYGLNINCIKSWESGRSKPEQPSCLILGLIDCDHERALDFFNAVETRQTVEAYRHAKDNPATSGDD